MTATNPQPTIECGPPRGWVYQPNTDSAWRDHAACADLNGKEVDAILYVKPNNRTGMWDAGRALCGACPVREACLDWALTNGETQGMWGGCTPAERQQLSQRYGITPRHLAAVPTVDGIQVTTDACGTDAGYKRHQRRREATCPACKQAHAVYKAERKGWA